MTDLIVDELAATVLRVAAHIYNRDVDHAEPEPGWRQWLSFKPDNHINDIDMAIAGHTLINAGLIEVANLRDGINHYRISAAGSKWLREHPVVVSDLAADDERVTASIGEVRDFACIATIMIVNDHWGVRVKGADWQFWIPMTLMPEDAGSGTSVTVRAKLDSIGQWQPLKVTEVPAS